MVRVSILLHRSVLIISPPQGKYVGNRPVKLKKADDTAIRPVEIGHRKAKKLEQDLKKNRRKPY